MARVHVVGLDHVGAPLRDIEASITFYCDELGLTPDRVEEVAARGDVLPSVRIDRRR